MVNVFDTIEIPLDKSVRFSKAVDGVIDELRAPTPAIPFSRNRYFHAVVDLRETSGIDAIMHLQSRGKGGHKIQIVEAGRKCRGELAETIAACVQQHPELCAVSRADACADFCDGPDVAFFARAIRAKSAQWQAQFGIIELRDETGRSMQWSEMGKRVTGTIYAGKRPNCIRVYDKRAERMEIWKRERRRHYHAAFNVIADKVVTFPMNYAQMPKWMKKNFIQRHRGTPGEGPGGTVPFPDFESWFAEQCTGPMRELVRKVEGQSTFPGMGVPEQLEMVTSIPRVLTRIERQMGAGRVPAQLDTFEKLFVNGMDYNPFERVEFVPSPDPDAKYEDFSPRDLLAGLMMRQLLTGQVCDCPECGKRSIVPPEMTYQQLTSFLNSNRNWNQKLAQRFAPFLKSFADVHAVTSAELFENYRESVRQQMAA